MVQDHLEVIKDLTKCVCQDKVPFNKIINNSVLQVGLKISEIPFNVKAVVASKHQEWLDQRRKGTH